jgi:hypothetical protein
MDTNCTWLTTPPLFDDLCTKITNCCWTVRQNRKLMPKSSGQKILPHWVTHTPGGGELDRHGEE